MKSNYFTTVLIMSSFLLANISVTGQTSNSLPKNYFGILGGVEWNTLSVAAGVEYERVVYERKQLTLGLKGVAVLPYRYGNVAILGQSDGSRSVTKVAIMGAGNFFLNGLDTKKGLYLCGGTGLGVVTDKYRLENGEYGNNSLVRFSGETGAGVQVKLSTKMTMRISGTVFWGMFKGGYTVGRIAVGF